MAEEHIRIRHRLFHADTRLGGLKPETKLPAFAEQEVLGDFQHAFQQSWIRGKAQHNPEKIGPGKVLAVLREQSTDLSTCFVFIHQW